MNDLMELKGRLMAQAALLPGKPANNYMVAIEFDGERQVNVVPVSGCEDGCTATIKLAIEYLHSFGHTGMATDALVCGTGFWYRPPEQLIRQMQRRAPDCSQCTHAMGWDAPWDAERWSRFAGQWKRRCPSPNIERSQSQACEVSARQGRPQSRADRQPKGGTK